MAPLLTSLTTIINQFGIGAVLAAPSGGGSPLGLTATGGVISDYTSGPAVYRAHVFTSSGTFSVSAFGAYGSNVEYLVVAGGGAGAAQHGGGGGAGGYRTATGFPVSTSPGSYTVTIGAGAGGGFENVGNSGSPSVFAVGNVGVVTSIGGGGGGRYSGPGIGAPGGSGGGGGNGEGTTRAGGTGQDYPGPNQQGYPGGLGEGEFGTTYKGGGGGGAGGAGTNGSTSPIIAGAGGPGLPSSITGITTHYAGGGGGGSYSPATPQSAIPAVLEQSVVKVALKVDFVSAGKVILSIPVR